MDTLLYLVARTLIAALQLLPLTGVALLGRFLGGVAHAVDKKHRTLVQNNLAASFPEKSPEEIRALASENFRRIGENLLSAVKTASMTEAEIRKVLTVTGAGRYQSSHNDGGHLHPSRVFAVGHFGNFEIYARTVFTMPGAQFATTYRGFKSPGLNKLLQTLRARSGCLFFERRTDADALRTAMQQGGIMLGLLADQHAGDKGLKLPFLGRDCSTSTAPALFALRYDCALFTAICYRTALARWQVEVGEPVPTRHPDGTARTVAEIMLDVNRAFEVAVRRDPANWFWVHNRWKPGKWRERTPPPSAQGSEVADG